MSLQDDLLLNGYYTMRLWIGTPPQMFALIVDAGSTVTYVPCSSLISNSSSIERERDHFLGEEFEVEVEKLSSKVRNFDGEDINPRKKLKLTKEQSAVLEVNFEEHSTLNLKQKRELARKLNLRVRQVEVWFQNRRANCSWVGGSDGVLHHFFQRHLPLHKVLGGGKFVDIFLWRNKRSP